MPVRALSSGAARRGGGGGEGKISVRERVSDRDAHSAKLVIRGHFWFFHRSLAAFTSSVNWDSLRLSLMLWRFLALGQFLNITCLNLAQLVSQRVEQNS